MHFDQTEAFRAHLVVEVSPVYFNHMQLFGPKLTYNAFVPQRAESNEKQWPKYAFIESKMVIFDDEKIDFS